jgi:hypothetical protein
MWAERLRLSGAGVAMSMAMLVACADPPPSGPSLCGGVSTYFPAGALGRKAKMHAFVSAWYSKHLEAMKEPSFQCETPYPVYRFLWLRTFHHPIAIRVEQRPDGMHVFAIELDGAGGYEPGTVSRRVARTLRHEEAQNFSHALERANIWGPMTEQNEMGLDGARWVVEARHGNRYQLHDRWTPDDGAVRDMGVAFLALTGWNIPKDELY